jgi:hypothetical protein
MDVGVIGVRGGRRERRLKRRGASLGHYIMPPLHVAHTQGTVAVTVLNFTVFLSCLLAFLVSCFHFYLFL